MVQGTPLTSTLTRSLGFMGYQWDQHVKWDPVNENIVFFSILCLSVFSHERFYLSFVLLVFFHSARIFYSTLYASCFLRLPPLCLVSLYVLFFLRLSYSLWIFELSCFSFIALLGPQGAGCCCGTSWLKSEMGTYLQSLWNGTWVERKTLGRKSLFTYVIFISFGSLITRSKWHPL